MAGNSGPLGLLKLTKSSDSKPEITFCKKKGTSECVGQLPCGTGTTCNLVVKKMTGSEMTKDKYKTSLWKIGYLR
ncbi:hypothetical protein DNK47_00815 [Mycoplasma wenyonii]|uniref:Uncharacterized protein n=1 Tax=Mycoplasma wenyonii TaxID=65123 RepID=A0A328PPS8_9MOLU|nr:hypothetical protein [Mycoplasma wenyonii]RAO95156.1 hypothetical protein DNK47_00815 [Mycoplasma wenyonii]